MRVAFLNGPAQSGKDTTANLFRGELINGIPVHLNKTSIELKLRTHALYGMPDEPHDAFEQVKDKPNDRFFGLTPRQAYIEVSERYLKPMHGDDIMGRLLAARLSSIKPSYAIIDCGFGEEAAPIADLAGRENCLIVHIQRPGRSFRGDSRGYFDLEGVRSVTVNNVELATFQSEMRRAVGDYLRNGVWRTRAKLTKPVYAPPMLEEGLSLAV